MVELRITATTVEVLHGGKRVAAHALNPRPGSHTTTRAHVGLAPRAPAVDAGQAHRLGRARGRDDEPTRDRSRLMAAVDAINGRFGKGTVHSGATGQSGPQRTAAVLGHEAGEKDAAVHDAAGGCAGGEGVMEPHL
jgi:hypothetical protein